MRTAAHHTVPDDTTTVPAWFAWLPPYLRRPLENNPALRKIGSNTSWLMLERLVDLTIRFFVGAWVIRYLGPEHYGIYNYALSFVALFSVFATLGLDKIVVRNLARNHHDPGVLLGTALALRFVAALFTLGGIVVLTISIEAVPLRRLAILLVAGQLIFQSANVFDLWFQAQVRSKYVVWARITVTVLFLGSQIACILLHLPLHAFLLLFLVQAALNALGLFICFRIAGPQQVRLRVHASIAKNIFRDAWPLLFAGLSISIYMRIDQVMLGTMIGNAAVGIYGAAVKVSELWYFVPTALVTSVFPSIVQMRMNAPAAVYRARLQMLYDGMALFSYVVILLVTLFATPIVHLLFGSEYVASVAILQVHIWALLFVSMGIARAQWLVAENLTLFSMTTTVLGAVANIGLNIILIPHFEGLGAAWATLLSYALAAYLSSLLFKPLRPVFFQLTKAVAAPFRLHTFLKSKPS